MSEEQLRYRPYRYDGPIFAAFGSLTRDGDRVVCHVCGRTFRSVAVHAAQAHGISADDYREAFGLGRTTALECRETRAKRAVHGAAMVKRYGSRLVGAPRGTAPSGPVRPEVRLGLRDRNRAISAAKRRDVCSRGHSMATHAYVKPSGKRRCRVCQLEAERRRTRRDSERRDGR